MGQISVAEDVVAVISSMATLETEGITALSSGIVEGIARRVSGKQVHKGINVQIEGNQVTINLRVIVQYGKKIDEVCFEVQRNVKEAVEQMTGLAVHQVNIRVEGVEMAPSPGQVHHHEEKEQER